MFPGCDRRLMEDISHRESPMPSIRTEILGIQLLPPKLTGGYLFMRLSLIMLWLSIHGTGMSQCVTVPATTTMMNGLEPAGRLPLNRLKLILVSNQNQKILLSLIPRYGLSQGPGEFFSSQVPSCTL